MATRRKPKPQHCPHCGELFEEGSTIEAEVWPDEMDLTQVGGPSGQNAWRQALLENIVKGRITDTRAKIIDEALRKASSMRTADAGKDEGAERVEDLFRRINERLHGENSDG